MHFSDGVVELTQQMLGIIQTGVPCFRSQNVEERPAGGGHDREPGGAGSPAGQGEAGVSGWVWPPPSSAPAANRTAAVSSL